MRYAWLIILVMLQACTAGGLDLAKEQPLPQNDPLTAPPWEALVQAGPNAHLEIDFETLNGPNAIEQTDLALTEAKAPDPTKPQIKTVAVPLVTGAKTKGNAELTAAMRSELEKAGWPIVPNPQSDSLSIEGKVEVKPQGAEDAVTIIWLVKSPKGEVLGDLKQESTMPKGAIDKGFGGDAAAIAEAAKPGIFEIVAKYQ